MNTTPQRVPGFVDYAIYGKPLCAQDSFTNERLHYACGWGAGSSTIACDGKDSIPWVVHNNIKTAGYTFTFRANPWMLLYQQGDCDTHANLMKDVLAILGVPATTTRIAPSGPSTRNSCGIPEHYRYGNVEQKRFRYDNGGNPVYVNWHAVCTVKTADKGIIHYDIIGHRAYGTPAQMTDEDEDRTKADFKNDVINGDIGWVYDLKDNQRGVCPVP